MKKAILTICFILVATQAQAQMFEPFDKKDWAWQAGFTSLVLVDWAQTREGYKYPHLSEKNPILGEHPSSTAIDLYMPTAALAHGLVSWMLPKKANFFNICEWHPRRTWQLVWIGVEVNAINNNYQVGIRISI